MLSCILPAVCFPNCFSAEINNTPVRQSTVQKKIQIRAGGAKNIKRSFAEIAAILGNKAPPGLFHSARGLILRPSGHLPG
jgi:hypothetical protein